MVVAVEMWLTFGDWPLSYSDMNWYMLLDTMPKTLEMETKRFIRKTIRKWTYQYISVDKEKEIFPNSMNSKLQDN